MPYRSLAVPEMKMTNLKVDDDDSEARSDSAERAQPPPVGTFNLPLPATVPSSELVSRGTNFFFFDTTRWRVIAPRLIIGSDRTSSFKLSPRGVRDRFIITELLVESGVMTIRKSHNSYPLILE